jgi:hypothetical protein
MPQILVAKVQLLHQLLNLRMSWLTQAQAAASRELSRYHFLEPHILVNTFAKHSPPRAALTIS